MQQIAMFAMRLSVMALLLGVSENLVPTGEMKQTAQIGFGLVFVSYTVTELVGIIGRMGV